MLKVLFLCVLFYNFHKQIQAANFDFTACSWEYDQTPSTGTHFYRACPGYVADYTHLRINYLDYPPYIYSDGNNGSPKGIWVDFLKDFTNRACGSRSSAIQWIRRTHKKAYDLQNYCRTNTYQCAMAIPSVGRETARVLNRNEWVNFWTINGIALVSIPGETWRSTLSSFSAAIISTWPFFLLCLIAAFIAGFVIWLLDTWFNEKEFPRPYYQGIYEGSWCAFVSMTTVGYGDKAPRSVPARAFAVFWIVIGICMIGILTSLLSSGLTSALYEPELTFMGREIGCLETVSSVQETIDTNGGTAKIAKDYLELESWMARGLIDGFAMDTRQLQYYYKTRLSKLKPKVTFKLEKVYEYTKAYGMIVQDPHSSTYGYRVSSPARGHPWDDCMSYYMDMNSDRQPEMEAYYTEKLKDVMDPTILQPPASSSFQIIDPDSAMFQNLMWTCFAIIVTILVVGIAFECFRRVFFRPGANVSSGLSSNSGYNGSGESRTDGPDDKQLSREERNVQELVDKTLKNAEKSLQETERAVHNEIMEMSRSIRREMVELKRRGKKDYGL